ncbi:hypothetical protein roselon_01380 [Roseibacterium elongatum DSM 19469]|uniref:Uncharacterized protein n=1 Tax=Roseicyclus elongatus DSM 19469 TaxID=1294273 RepID=W8S0T0_9RHOB|nr:hypothetical protein roselon_01380 [Roseibacterium elongatum DSM 19469]
MRIGLFRPALRLAHRRGVDVTRNPQVCEEKLCPTGRAAPFRGAVSEIFTLSG